MENRVMSGIANLRERKDIGANSNLTKLQLLYWIGQSLRPSSPLFNQVLTFRWQAPVDERLFSEAFAVVAQHSDTLRTVIREEGGVPQRHILPEPPQPLEILDFSKEADPEDVLQHWLTTRSQRALDISKCVYDVALIKLDEEAYFWYINKHHLIADATSIFILYRRVLTLYQEAKEGGTMTPKSDIPSFEAYVKSEKEYSSTPRYKKSADFWRKRLATGIEPLKFYGRSPHKKSHKMQRISYELDLERSRQMKEALQRPGVFNLTQDLAMLNVLLTIHFTHLHYMTGNQRLATMMPFHNRPTKPMKRTIGLLMEICPIIIEFGEGETFSSLTKKISKSLQQTLVHYQYGTAVAMENRLLDIMFNFVHRPEVKFEGRPVKQALIHPNAGSDSFALHIHEFEQHGTFTFFFDFHEDVFTQAERDLTLAAFEQILNAYLAGVDLPLSDLDLPAAVAPLAPADGAIQTNGTHGDRAPFVAPRNELEQQLAETWRQVLGTPEIGIHDDFFDLGGNSWTAVHLFTEMQNVTGHNLPLATLFRAPTIAALAEFIRHGEDAQIWTSLVPIRTSGSKPPFFCIHGVTGDILWLKDLAGFMNDEQPFYGVQARGLDGEAEPFNRLEDMAAHYLQQIRQVQPSGPYYLGGYCMGGDIAYEMARQLQAQGEEVPILAVIDPPPAKFNERVPMNGRFIMDFVQNGPYWLREFLRLGGGEISSRLRRKGRVALRALWQKIRLKSNEGNLNATDVIDQADNLPEHRQQVIESHLEALLHYTHAGYDGDVILFEAQSRPLLNPGHNAHEWVDYVSRPFTLRTVPGSHSSMLHKPHVAGLARSLQNSLDQARAAREAIG